MRYEDYDDWKNYIQELDDEEISLLLTTEEEASELETSEESMWLVLFSMLVVSAALVASGILVVIIELCSLLPQAPNIKAVAIMMIGNFLFFIAKSLYMRLWNKKRLLCYHNSQFLFVYLFTRNNDFLD